MKNFLELIRIKDWRKGLFVLLGVIYTNLSGFWPKALLATLSFCLISSAVYIYNDIKNLEEDRNHPDKKHRPLARGAFSFFQTYIFLAIFLIAGLVLGATISLKLLTILSLYIIINILYNHGLRNILIADVLCIASGFMLRVFAGTIGIGLALTFWLTAAATLLSLLIAFGKRFLEMTLRKLSEVKNTRKVLKKYSQKALNNLMFLSASGSFITYVLYVFYVHNHSFFFLLTLPFSAFGLWRFIILMNAEYKNDDPIAVFFKDNLSFINFLIFGFLTVIATYLFKSYL